MPREIVVVSRNLAKTVFQVHDIDAQGQPVVRRQLRRTAVLKFFADPPPCQVGTAACTSAHYWGQKISTFGHEVRLMPPA